MLFFYRVNTTVYSFCFFTACAASNYTAIAPALETAYDIASFSIVGWHTDYAPSPVRFEVLDL